MTRFNAITAAGTPTVQKDPVDTIAALKSSSVAGFSGGETRFVHGYYAAGDGGGGTFRYNASSTATDDAGITLAPTVGSGRWIRIYSGAINAKWFGAKGDNSTDDTAAINAALAAAGSGVGGVGGKVYLPESYYRVVGALSSWPDYVTMVGDGPEGSTMVWAGSSGAIMADWTNANSRRMQDIQLYSTNTNFTFIKISNGFQNSFRGVRFIGTHGAGGVDQPNQRAIYLTGNSGNNNFADSDFFNVGEAIRVGCIMNWAVNCNFTQNYKSIVSEVGTAGFGATNCNFASTPANCPVHVEAINGSNNSWWFNSCWFEGSQKGLVFGSTGVIGPLELTLSGVSIAATVRHLEVNQATGMTLNGLRFAQYGGSGPTSGQIYLDPGWVDGVAINLHSDLTGGTVPASSIPDFVAYITGVGPSKTGPSGLIVGTATGPQLLSGTGSPASAVSAPVGSLYMRIDGGPTTSIYVKESGTGNTGWAAK